MSVADVLKQIKSEDVKYVDLRFTDTRGKEQHVTCLLYTSPSPRDQRGSRMPSSA